jgi:hypothetical protein
MLGAFAGCSLFTSTDTAAPTLPESSPAIPNGNKVVLSSGDEVIATSAAGKIAIEAGPGLRRIIDWDGMRRGVITKARTEPFGSTPSKGITFKGAPKVWASSDGVTKLRYEEGYWNFENANDALIWMSIRRLHFTYNDHGLAVGWKRHGDTLHVEVWQFTIDDKKPTTLPKAHDNSISVTPTAVAQEKT